MRLVKEWHQGKFKTLWTVKLASGWAIFWTVVAAAYLALPAFINSMPPLLFFGLCVIFGIVLLIARVTKQPGID